MLVNLKEKCPIEQSIYENLIIETLAIENIRGGYQWKTVVVVNQKK